MAPSSTVFGALRRASSLGALLALPLALTTTPASAQAEAGARVPLRIAKAGVLRWGGDRQGGEPFVYEDERGALVGFEVSIAKALGARLHLREEFVQNDWAALVPSLERGDFDVILNGFEVTRDHAARVAFTRPYYAIAERLTARHDDPRFKGAGGPSLEWVRGKRVGTLAGTLAEELLVSHGADVVRYEGTEEPYFDLAQGRSDAVLLDDIISARYGERKRELTVVGDVAEGTYAIGTRKGDPELTRAVDSALGAMIADGELEAILRGAHLWNERQTRLAAPPASSQDRGPGDDAPPPPPTFGLSHALRFLWAALVTLFLSTSAMALAIPGGISLALARLYGPRWLGRVAHAYVEVYRGTPVLLQLYVLYYGLAPWLPLPPLAAAVVGLGMNYMAYEAEVYRAGIQAVPKGQMEAALSLGMSLPLALRRVILPQAFKNALPNVTNDFIALLKDSSLVSVITVVELTKQATITAVDVRGWLLPGALCAALYFAMSYPLGAFARRLEAKLARS